MTYPALAGLFLLGALLVLAAVASALRPGRRWWGATLVTAAALVVLTAVFDNVMIAADLFRFDEDALSGVHLGLAPVEDFAWPLASVALLPALWLLLGRRDR
ncbi:lycopene cyclase domain-containing protein [Nocardioides ferulae]|uniref:lycopene cyclase domain-containing protein n=1 Tax=Nocardioides ferulae TaxID=2340821 RepID=UPI000EAF0331|nr:lycopene cyclase domain-containing protein [Nocardioides ferulae]